MRGTQHENKCLKMNECAICMVEQIHLLSAFCIRQYSIVILGVSNGIRGFIWKCGAWISIAVEHLQVQNCFERSYSKYFTSTVYCWQTLESHGYLYNIFILIYVYGICILHNFTTSFNTFHIVDAYLIWMFCYIAIHDHIIVMNIYRLSSCYHSIFIEQVWESDIKYHTHWQ